MLDQGPEFLATSASTDFENRAIVSSDAPAFVNALIAVEAGVAVLITPSVFEKLSAPAALSARFSLIFSLIDDL